MAGAARLLAVPGRALQDGDSGRGLACHDERTSQADAGRDDSGMPRRELTASFGQHPLVPGNGLCRVACRQIGGSQSPATTRASGCPGRSLASHRAASSRQYSTVGPAIWAPSRLRPARSSSGWHPSDHSVSAAAVCKLAAFARSLSATHGCGSSSGHVSSNALADARAAIC